ncbi:MAG: Leucine, isoleucine, valine-, threonine-, and alanine-binding protein [Proteobacteria bacterium]|nr:Leucine, isoleucine, valine-, threonine-, and alanine-binding protein [Pseudomonadota bacterium]
MSKCAFSILAFAIAAFSGSAANAVEPIKLGATVPLNDITGRDSAKAMALAIKEINQAGGVLGRRLELIVLDDEMDPGKGAAAIEKLATVDKVDFFVGGMSSSVHLSQIPVMKKYNKVTLWSGAASSKVERALKDQDWYFHLHPWDYQQAQAYIAGWQAIGNKYPEVKMQKWFYAYEDGAFGFTTFKAFSEALPKEWTLQGAFFKSASSGGGDYRGVLKRAKEENPDIFVWAGYEADAALIMKFAKEIDFHPAVFIGSPPGWAADFGKSSMSENVVCYATWSTSMKGFSKASRRYYDAYKTEFNTEPNSYLGPLSYSSIHMLAEAIKKAGSLDKNALIAALEKTKYVSPLGETITFAPSKIIKHQGLRGQKIMQWQNGILQVIWPFEYATAKLVHPYQSKAKPWLAQ